MNCIRCGREIPENEMFCSVCKLPPVTVLPDEAQVAPSKKQQRAAKELQRQKRASNPKVVRRLVIALLVAIALLIGCGVSFFSRYDEYHKKKENLRIREANIARLEQEVDKLNANIRALEEELAKTKQQLDEARKKLSVPDLRVTAKR